MLLQVVIANVFEENELSSTEIISTDKKAQEGKKAF